MRNKPKNIFSPGSKRNNFDNPALLEVEDKIKTAQHQGEQPSDDFNQRLKSQILTARKEKKSMKFSFNMSWFRPKFFAPALSLVIIVGLVVASINLIPLLKQNDLLRPFGEFSKLVISPAYAQDNFEVFATEGDALGVIESTRFTITSKEVIDTNLLRDSVSLVPMVDFSLKKINDHEFELTPKESLESRQVYSIQIASAFIDDNGIQVQRDYSWAFQVKDQFKVLQTLPRDKATNVPLDTGIEITFSHDNFINPEDFISITPHLEGSFEIHKRTVVFVPKNLAQGVVYTVTVDKGLELEGSKEGLIDNFTFQFETSSKDYSRGAYRYLDFSENFNEFASNQEPALRIYSHNYSKPHQLKMYAFKSEASFIEAVQELDDVPYWARYNQAAFTIDTSNLTLVGSQETTPQEYGFSNYLVYPEILPVGFYLAEVTLDGVTNQTFVQVSDIAVYTSVTVTDTLVWVNNVGGQGPTSGAKVSILGSNITTVTDADGVATFSTNNLVENLKGAETFYIKVEQGNQITYAPVTINESSIGREISGNNRYWSYFYTDRELYRPSDTIHFWGFVKNRDGSSVGDDFKVSLKDNRYRNYYFEQIDISKVDITINDDGSFVGSLDIALLTPGYYNLRLQQGDEDIINHGFSVRSFTKPAYQLEIDTQDKVVFAGQEASFTAKAKFFEDTPVANLDLNYSLDKKQENVIKTNEQGEAVLSLKTSQKTKDVSHVERIYISPTNSEAGDISAYTSVQVFDSKVIPDIKFEKIGDTEAKITVQMNQVDFSQEPDYKGDSAANIGLKIEFKRNYYEKIATGEYYDFINKVVRKKYRYERKTEVVDQTVLDATDASGQFTYTLPVIDGEFYEAEVGFSNYSNNGMIYKKAHLRGVRLSNYSSDDYYSLESLNDALPSINDEVSFEFLKEDESLPVSNSKRFLYYKLQRGLIDFNVTQSPFYQFKFQPQHVPNVYVRGVWFDGAAYHIAKNTRWFSGSSGSQVKYNYEDRELSIAITSDQDSYKPGEQVELSLQVTDRQGKGVQSAVNVSLVDEALFKLRNQSADVLSSLYANVRSGELITYNTHRAPSLSSNAEGGGCFTAGTKVLMSDGSEKNIEDIIAGDKILTFESERAERLVSAEVLETYVHDVSEYWIINDHLEVTPEHRVFINGGWMMIGEAKIGDYLLNQQGVPEIIETIERVRKPVTVYNLNVDFFHTYIANGIYVHNDKGGVRDEFVDTAYFSSVTTNNSGFAKVSFTLPDNITSWRVTTQAISQDLGAATDTQKIKVSLPLFVDDVYAKDYVAGDQPVVKLRAFGEVLKTGDLVSYSLEAPSLQVDEQTQGQAFQSSYIQLPVLSSGVHEITTKADIGEHDDIVVKLISVQDSRLKVSETKFYEMTPDLRIEGSADDRTDVIFSDKNQGFFYQAVAGLRSVFGDRIDQKLSRVIGNELHDQYFNSRRSPKEDFDGVAYQLTNGGISLLPYSDADLELTAKISAVASNKFDEPSLANYFYKVLNDKNSNKEEVGIALFGLASLGEPVLFQVQSYAAIDSLTTKEKLYIALASLKLGDGEQARTIFNKVMSDHGELLDPYVRVKSGTDQDDHIALSSLAAILAGGLGDELHKGLWLYVRDNYAKDILINLEALLYLSSSLPKLIPGEVSFTINIGNKQITQTLDRGRTFTISLTPEEIDELKFSNISGQVGVVSSFDKPATASSLSTSPFVSVTREYYVGGKKTDTFSQNDIVEVVLRYTVNRDSLDGLYEIIDILPSGLSILTRPYSRGIRYDCTTRYPHLVNGQKASFLIGKNYYPNCGRQIKYFARVIGPGSYIAEPATIQSLKSDEIINISGSGEVIIKQ